MNRQGVCLSVFIFTVRCNARIALYLLWQFRRSVRLSLELELEQANNDRTVF